MKAVTTVLFAILAVVLVGVVDLECVSAFTTTTTTTNPTTTTTRAMTTASTTRATVLLQATRNYENNTQQKNNIKNKKMIMSKSQKDKIVKTKLFGTAILSASLIFFSSMVALTSAPQPVNANEGSKVVGTLKGSGLVFKDTLNIERFEDPKVKGVVLYISNFDRPVTEKLSKGNFFNDPSQASVACARTGTPVSIASNIAKGTGGEEVFEESRSLLFKTLRVQRVYDEDKK
jgi:catabolite regulation protein CreA